MAFQYIRLDEAIKTHALTVEKSGGGASGHLNVDKLASVLEHIQNDDYYPTLDEKLTHLFHSACMFHCFEDGNKRIAISLCAQMLLINGYMFDFIRKAENISYHVAAGEIDKDLLGEWIKAVLVGEEENEMLQLKIVNAIS